MPTVSGSQLNFAFFRNGARKGGGKERKACCKHRLDPSNSKKTVLEKAWPVWACLTAKQRTIVDQIHFSLSFPSLQPTPSAEIARRW